MSNLNNGLRLAIATEIQRLRRVKSLPIYDKDELREVVDAWYPIIEEAGIKPQWLPDLTVFSLARRDPNKIFGADDLARSWPIFIDRKLQCAYQDYYEALDNAGDDEIARATATRLHEQRISGM